LLRQKQQRRYGCLLLLWHFQLLLAWLNLCHDQQQQRGCSLILLLLVWVVLRHQQ
jgi:hypothetical protein